MVGRAISSSPPSGAPASARCRRSRAYQHYVRFAPKTPGGLCGPLDVQRSRPRLDVYRPGIRAAHDRDSPGASRVRPWPPPCPRARGVLDSERRVRRRGRKVAARPTEQSSRRDPWHRTDAVDSRARQTGARYAPGAFAVSRPRGGGGYAASKSSRSAWRKRREIVEPAIVSADDRAAQLLAMAPLDRAGNSALHAPIVTLRAAASSDALASARGGRPVRSPSSSRAGRSSGQG